MGKKAHYTIGFFTVGSTFNQSDTLAKYIEQAAKTYKVNIITFLGGVLNTSASYTQYNYQRQCNVVFEFAKSEKLDGIIIASHLLAAYQGVETLVNLCTSFAPTPIVSLGLELPNVPSVYTDNTSNIKQMVSHIIEKHNRRKIGFLSGPSNNADAFNHYLGYTMALEEHHIEYRPDFVHIGDFTPESAKEAIHIFFDERQLDLDAIVCTTDTLALTVLRELQKRDILVPEQIIVTGYGNIPSSTSSFPSLTTIEQPLEKLANQSIELLINLIKGGSPTNIVIPSHLILRRSCDCHLVHYSNPKSSPNFVLTHKDAIILANEFIKHKSRTVPDDVIQAIRNFIIDSYQFVTSETINVNVLEPAQIKCEQFLKAVRPYLTSSNVIFNLRTYISILKSNLMEFPTSPDVIRYLDEVYTRIIYELLNYWIDYNNMHVEHLKQNFSLTQDFLLTLTQYLGDLQKQLYATLPTLIGSAITSYMIYLYPDGIRHQASDIWKMPSELLFYVGYINGEMIRGENFQSSSSSLSLTPEQILTYSFEERFHRYATYIHTLSIDEEQLGIMVFQINLDKYSIIDSLAIELACALKLTFTFSTQRQLENKLETLSQTDELTHLFNRRGFLNLARERFKFSRFDDETGILFYADMDGLKKINDTYGHAEGDFAIITMSHILQDTFLKPDIVGRIGGDEFVILSTDQDRSYIEYVTMRLNQLCNEFNASSGKPYLLSISVGGVAYGPDDNHTLETLMTKADELLYERKQRKKKRQLTDFKAENFELL